MPSAPNDRENMIGGLERTNTEGAIVRLAGAKSLLRRVAHLSFWADISHRCMTASWPAFIAGAALVLSPSNAVFAVVLLDRRSADLQRAGRRYIDYLYFSIENALDRRYGTCIRQTHYGHFIATVELFYRDLFDVADDGLDLRPVSRPTPGLLFATIVMISNHEGVPTLMVASPTNGHNIIGKCQCKAVDVSGISRTGEGQPIRRFTSSRCCGTRAPRSP